jgi:hypothetical protein
MKGSASIRFKQAFACLAAAALLLLPASSAFAFAPGAAGSYLIATTGHGAGHVTVTPTAQASGTFAAEITVNIHGAAPNTTFSIQRTPDLVPDGICTGPLIPFGVSLTTKADGAGATSFHFERGAPFVAGVQFDVAFRVIGSDGTVLQGDCMRVTVQ